MYLCIIGVVAIVLFCMSVVQTLDLKGRLVHSLNYCLFQSLVFSYCGYTLLLGV